MKIILSLLASLIIIAGFMGCSTTSNNANLRNTNTNTGYMVNNANMPSRMPTSNMNSYMTNTSSNSGSKMNSNAKPR